MLLVKTKKGVSAIHGIGLFADEFIPEGRAIWIFHPGFDQRWPSSALTDLPEPARAQLEHYGYTNMVGDLVLCADDARFFNHSSDPNTKDVAGSEEGITVAARDIFPHEEITCDYNRMGDF